MFGSLVNDCILILRFTQCHNFRIGVVYIFLGVLVAYPNWGSPAMLRLMYHIETFQISNYTQSYSPHRWPYLFISQFHKIW